MTRAAVSIGLAAIAALVAGGASAGAGLAGCSGESAPPAPPHPRPAPVHDAGVPGITTLPGTDPTSGHLDDGPDTARVSPSRPKNRQPRPIDISLRSSPPGALAAVDGRPIGTTPAFWSGESDGLEHEFTFTRRGYASARYRFVPVTSGVLHATLEPVAVEVPDGGIGPMIAPQFAPAAPVAPAAEPAAPVPHAPAPPAPDASVAAPPAEPRAPSESAPGGIGPTP